MVGLASTAIALLAPWLSKVGEGAAKKLGESAVIHLGELYGLLKSGLTGDDSLILLKLEQNPNDSEVQRQAAEKLALRMNEDPVLKINVERSIEKAKADPAIVNMLTQVYGGEVGKIVNIANAGDVTIS
jgi:hypothetical protein